MAVREWLERELLEISEREQWRIGQDGQIVLNVTNYAVTISDPLNGLEMLSPQKFLEQWRYCEVMIQKHQPNLNPVLKTMDQICVEICSINPSGYLESR